MTSRSASLVAEQRSVLERVEELEARKAALFVEAAALRAEIGQLWESERSGFAEMELAGSALIGQIRASRELTDGHRLTQLFPRLAEQAAAGVVFVPTVEAVLLATRRCTEQVQLVIDARLSGLLVGRNVTDVRRLVQHTVLAVEAEIDPDLTRQRQDEARQDARVWVSPGDDGMTSIGAVIDAVAGRRWALDFEQLVHAQQVLDKRDGRDRTLQQVQAEVFATLPSLVLALVTAARDGVLTDLAEQADRHPDLDPDALAEVEALAESLTDQSLNNDPRGETAVDDAVAPTDSSRPSAPEHDASRIDPATGPELDPFDAIAGAIADLDPTTDLIVDLDAEPPAPDVPEGPPPTASAAQDAADRDNLSSTRHDSRDLTLQDLLLRCLRMPLSNPTVLTLHLPMATVLDLSHAPGFLEGYGPLPARRVRELLPDARLKEVYVDRDTGIPLGSGKVEPWRLAQAERSDLGARLRNVTLTDTAEHQHDPSPALAAFVKLRDQRCSGPGCTMPASQCDLDHEVAFPDGPTAEWNLGDKSRRCHGAKHHGWTVTRHPDGRADWVSPTRRTYTSHPQWQPPPAISRPFNVTFHLPPTETLVEIGL
ncbi:MAG: hypothetical protein JWO22_1914 [Frankiales bacterium]|nr:hypothetical protein [Frankiales bacterium]